MAIKIAFDVLGNPQLPTMVLAKRNGDKMGEIKGFGVTVADYLTDASEIQFEVNKYDDNGDLTNLWFSIIDFRLLWCKEWDMWFEITVDIDEATGTKKTVSCKQLGQAELSQIQLYDIHINDEDDILRDDYTIPTVLYNPEHPEASLLNRITEHAPHYYIKHVDSTIMNIQRTFTFDSESILDAFNEIAEEIECIFILESCSNEDGGIDRSISVYDLDANCNTCGYRGDFTDVCPECGSTDINEGYGEDTTIFISAEELASEIQFGTDTDAVKNCFKLEGGDDLMTATIRNCNPNGSDRIWYITEQTKADMSDELLEGLADYDAQYEYYQNEYVVNIPSDMISAYNDLVTKYREYNPDIETLPSQIVGYPALMEAYYDTIDFALYLQSVLMPDATISDTTAAEQAALLTRANLSPVAVSNTGSLSTSSANNAVLAMAKVVVDPRYQVKVNEGNLDWMTWTGNFKVTNYSDEDDTAISSAISVTITDDYEEYLRQMIEKELNDDEVNDMSITYLFMEMSYTEFCAEIKKYCLDSLNMFWDAGQACLDILIEQGIADKETWGSSESGASSNLYEILYVPYYEKQEALEAEIKVREDEINLITGVYDDAGLVTDEGVQTYIIGERNMIQSALNFEDYLGTDLWLEFSAFRREDKFSNANYISDGLDNAELFSRAWEFFQKAQEEIYKSAELQHSISTSLKNLLVIDKFKPLVDHFECGNWLRVKTDDSVYKLRLIEYEIDYDSIENISVDYSDVMKTLDGLSDKQDLISKMGSISSSYDAVEHQASQGSKASGTLDGWSLWGLDVDNVKLVQSADNETQSWDEHGMLFRKYDPITETFSDEQLKIIHSTMVITDDNWATVKTAVGGFYYYDPANDYQLTYAYGVNGEVIVGQLILGEQLGIYNEAGTLTFDLNGLVITNGINTFAVNPNSTQLLTLSNSSNDILYVDTSGNLFVSGVITNDNGLYRTRMNGGWINFWYDGNQYGLIQASYKKENSSVRGFNLSAYNTAQYLSLGYQENSSEAEFTPYYQIYFDDYKGERIYPETHQFWGGVRVNSGELHSNGYLYAHSYLYAESLLYAENTVYTTYGIHIGSNSGNLYFDHNGNGISFTSSGGDNYWGIWLGTNDTLYVGSTSGAYSLDLCTSGGRVYQLFSGNSWYVPCHAAATVSVTVSASNTPTTYTYTFSREFPITPFCTANLWGSPSNSSNVIVSITNTSTTSVTVCVTAAYTATFTVGILAIC